MRISDWSSDVCSSDLTDGQPLDDTQDLYTHAFIVFACTAYFERSHNPDARRALLQTAELIESRFRRTDGLYDAALAADRRQARCGAALNPHKPLAEP